MSNSHHRVLILGSGPAGLTAAVYTARASLRPLIIHGPLAGGQLMGTTDVENYPGFPEGVQGPELMKLMEDQAKRFGAEVLQETVTQVNLSKRPFTIQTAKQSISCDALIISTGASPKLLGLPKEKELMGYGVSTCATCDGAFFRNQMIAVSGGGDSACEEASFLTRFGSKVMLIHRREELRASKIMQTRVLTNSKIEMLWNKVIVDIDGSKEDGVKSLTLKDTKSGATSIVPAQALFVAIGHTPNSQIFKGQVETDENGYILTQEHSSRTNVEGVFACGDVQDHVYRQAVTAAGTGCMAAIDAERWLAAAGS